VYETPLFVARDPLYTAIWLLKSMEVYTPYPPPDLNLWPKKKHMFLIFRPIQVYDKYINLIDLHMIFIK